MWIQIDAKKEENKELVEQINIVKSFCGVKGIELVRMGLEQYKQSKEFKDKMEILKTQLNI